MQSDLDDYSSEAKSNMRARAMRVRKFLGYVSVNGVEYSRGMLVARFATENGVSASTVYGYASQLVEGGYLVLHAIHGNVHILPIPEYEKMIRKQAES